MCALAASDSATRAELLPAPLPELRSVLQQSRARACWRGCPLQLTGALGLANQRGHGVGRLGADRDPVVKAVLLERDAIVRRGRVVGAQQFEEPTIAARFAVSRNHAVEWGFLAAVTSEANTYRHGNSLAGPPKTGPSWFRPRRAKRSKRGSTLLSAGGRAGEFTRRPPGSQPLALKSAVAAFRRPWRRGPEDLDFAPPWPGGLSVDLTLPLGLS